MKHTIKKRFIILFFISILGLGTMSVIFYVKHKTNIQRNKAIATEQRLLQYELTVKRELEKYNLEGKTAVLLGIMYQESRGEGNDPMQSSESLGLKPNEIQETSLSIRQGVKHFAQMYKYGTEKDVSMETIIQSYNMGPGYIDFIASQEVKQHSEDSAKNFSKMKVDQNPEMYTCGGNKKNFRYPYCYGDFTYATRVNEKAKLIEELLRKNSKSNSEKL
ncbi:antigen [Bacillus cereus BAG1X2-3]|uniref:CwlT-like lysozyme domain-containing protein n=1 Tax=Bacillus cereus TaxID=1396 RepID=A0A9X7E1F6_BACCE|nr:lysozyme family protein [Bacillus cereus]EOO24356.1 antigen [Bacillus cereus BAG1X1-1]EOO43271.1 antigen [Bacillus cereus BAG1X2-1]EOO44642.1 antigen [Bacillus cereus BAG1X2-2]EOO62806.1 antigen [Bacillus cereus BAG1X2-3]EOP00821.1 antigen [Bacillus cereus BAG2O-1]